MVLAKADFAVGHHWATFQLTDEALQEPAETLRTAMAARSLPSERFRAMRAGESWDVPALPAL